MTNFDKNIALAETRQLQVLTQFNIRHCGKDVETLTQIYDILTEMGNMARNAMKRAKMPDNWCWHCDHCGFERDAAGRKNCFECGEIMRVRAVEQ